MVNKKIKVNLLKQVDVDQFLFLRSDNRILQILIMSPRHHKTCHHDTTKSWIFFARLVVVI